MPELIDYTIISHKSEYNTRHRGYIEILTSYLDFTSKMGLGNVPYVISRSHPILVILTRLVVTNIPSGALYVSQAPTFDFNNIFPCIQRIMPGITGYLIGQTVLVLDFDGNLAISMVLHTMPSNLH